MKIIPVLDLMKGLVVHGIRGERELYQPVQSILHDTAEPLEMARALHKETACHSIYIADLDAIQGSGNNNAAIREIASHLDVDLWVDAGTADPESVKQILAAGAGVVIVGSETLKSLQELKNICDSVARDKIIFSLDISNDAVLSRAERLKGIQPIEALSLLNREGMDRFILLTLDTVGTAHGPDLSLLREARVHFPMVTFIAGGGVKTPDHLHALSAAGASGVLVATSLHKGWITGSDLLPFKQ